MDYEQIRIDGNRRMTIPDMQLLEKTALEINPKVILEIGSNDGVSSIVLGLVAKQCQGKLFCVEPMPKGRWKTNMQKYGIEDRVTLIWKASPWVDLALIPKPIDYLFIDGYHKFRWVLVDYHYWSPFVRPGGRIAFHDWDRNPDSITGIRRTIEIAQETDTLIEVAKIGKAENGGTIVFEIPVPESQKKQG